MPCFAPLRAWRGPEGRLSFRYAAGNGDGFLVPCRQCIGCRLEYSRQWAVRLMHEAKLHRESAFVTLTYAPESLPYGGSLVKWHFQDFMKRLRARLAPRKIRFFHCGEYGERFDRPHYHAIIYGVSFPDCVFYKEANGQRYYTSEFLDSVWQHGRCVIGDVSFESAAYVARYVVKKVTGDAAEDHYWRVDETTGEAVRVEPEYCTMSRRPGIGAGAFDKWQSDFFPADEVIVNGFSSRPPRFYDKLYEACNPDGIRDIKRARRARAANHREDQTKQRLKDREKVKRAQLKFLKRGLEQ